MAKLKFDRTLNIKTEPGEKITVPNDEVWKGAIVYNSELRINNNTIESVHSTSSGGKYMFNPILPNIILGGAQFFTKKANTVEQFLQELHLRLFKNSAKEVSLA